MAKNKAENALNIENEGHMTHEQLTDDKLVGKGGRNGLNKGGHDRSTSLYHFPMQVPHPTVPPWPVALVKSECLNKMGW